MNYLYCIKGDTYWNLFKLSIRSLFKVSENSKVICIRDHDNYDMTDIKSFKKRIKFIHIDGYDPAFPKISYRNNCFRILIENYPNTEFAIDAGFKLGLITDRLAGKEMYIGRHYERSQKWVAAINRFKNVVENYETSIYVEEAIYRLAEIHYIFGLEDEANKYATLLGYNYGTSTWYKASYKIFNKDYDLSEKEIFSAKERDKKSIFKKFKKRFKNLFN